MIMMNSFAYDIANTILKKLNVKFYEI